MTPNTSSLLQDQLEGTMYLSLVPDERTALLGGGIDEP